MKRTRTVMTITTILTLWAGMSGCASSTDPDKVGLYYMKGSSDGYAFGHCMKPGASDDYKWNNEIVYLPNNIRTWLISPDDKADSKTAIVVTAKPAPGQTSGLQVSVWSKTNLKLNTNCNDKDGGPRRAFWDNLGKRYGANTDAGWDDMMRTTLVPALQKSINDSVRGYTDTELIDNRNGERADVQQKVGAQFATELRKMAGADYFCGPTFTLGNDACPPVEVIILDIDYTDPGIQEARNAKQKAVEEAAAKVAAAKGQVDAAREMDKLYQNEAWLALEKAKLELEKAKACAAAPSCTIILGDPDKVAVGK